MVCEIQLDLLEKLLRATPHGALRTKLFALRDQAYVTEFVDPSLLMAYETARIHYNVNHYGPARSQATGSGTTLH